MRLDVVESLLKDDDLLERLRDGFLRKMPDLDKLYSKFYKVKSGVKRHYANLGDVVKVYHLVIHSQKIIDYLTKVRKLS